MNPVMHVEIPVADLARALQAGATLRFGPAEAGGWHVAEMVDSEGNRIAVQAPMA